MCICDYERERGHWERAISNLQHVMDISLWPKQCMRPKIVADKLLEVPTPLYTLKNKLVVLTTEWLPWLQS